MTFEKQDFLETAIQLGFINQKQRETILRQLKERPENAAQLSLRLGYLTPPQIAEISRKNSSHYPETLVDGQQTKLPQEKIEIGQKWGSFEVLEKIGAGGMGTVYKVLQQGTNRIMALKILNSAEITSQQLERFFEEARIGDRLQHENIVRVYLADTHNEISYFAMQYIEGISLRDYLKKDFSLPQALEIMKKIAQALHYAHRHKIIHRDIKPANILLSKEGTPYLTDFGLARSTRVEDRNLTRTGEVLGTPHYMAPEQAQGRKREVDAKSDIYALGSILYEIATGKIAVQGNSLPEILFDVVHNEPPLPRTIKTDIARPLEAIIVKAMAKKKNKRYHNAQEFADDLEHFLAGKSVSVRAPNVFSRIKSSTIWLATAITITSLVVGWYFFRAKVVDPVQKIDSTAWKKQAQEALSAGDFQKAEEMVEKVLVHSPGDGEAVWLLAQIFQKAEKWEEMRLSWARFAELKPEAKQLEQIGRIAVKMGYLQEAHRYFKQSLKLSDSISCRKELAQLAWYFRNYKTAEKHYRILEKYNRKDPSVILGLALLHYKNQNYREALDGFNKLNHDKISDDIRSMVLFFRARAKWHLLYRDLNRWYWLRADPDRGEKYPVVSKKLTIIEKYLVETKKLLPANEDYFVLLQHRRIDFCLKVLRWENKSLAMDYQNITQYEQELAGLFFSTSMEIFFRELLVRTFLRNKQWQKAYKYSEQGLFNYPWVVNFYHLRSIASFHMGRTNEARDDIFLLAELKSGNYIPVENIISLLFERFTQEEAYEFTHIFLFYIDTLKPSLEQLIFNKFLQELTVKYLQETSLPETVENNEEQLNKWLNTLLYNDSTGARLMSFRLLISQYNNSRFMEKLSRLKKTLKDKKTRLRLRKLIEILENRKRSAVLLILKKNMVRHALSQQEEYLKQVYHMKNSGEMLKNILMDNEEAPMMRFLAAKMMVSLKKMNIFQEIYRIAHSDRFPQNLLATTALREDKFFIEIPSSLHRFLQNIDRDQLKNIEPFYQILIAYYFPPNRYPHLSHLLLHGDVEKARLCVAHHCRTPAYKIFSESRITEHFIQLMKSTDPEIRNISLQIFWSVKTINNMSNSDKIAIFARYWRAHGHLLIQSLEENDAQLSFSALLSLVISKYFDYYLRTEEARKDPKLKLLRKQISKLAESKDEFMRFWGNIALAISDTGQDTIWELLENPKRDFFIRMFAVYGLLKNIWLGKDTSRNFLYNQSHITRLLKWLQQQAQRQVHTESEMKMKQLSLVLITRLELPLISEAKISAMLHKILAKKEIDAQLKRTAVAALMWTGTASDIGRLKKYLRDEDIHVQRAAAASIATLLSRYYPERINLFHKNLEKYDPVIRSAAVLGHYDLIHRKFLSLFQLMSNTKLSRSYAEYFKTFRAQSVKSWIPHLDNTIKLSQEPRYFHQAAVVYAKHHQYRKAQRAIDQLFQKLDKTSSYWRDKFRQEGALLRIQIYHREKKIQQAIAFAQKITKEYPRNALIHIALCRLFLRKKNLELYNKHLLKAYICNPREVIAMANDLANKGRKKQAFKIVKLIYRKFPISPDIIFKTYPFLRNTPEAEFFLK